MTSSRLLASARLLTILTVPPSVCVDIVHLRAVAEWKRDAGLRCSLEFLLLFFAGFYGLDKPFLTASRSVNAGSGSCRTAAAIFSAKLVIAARATETGPNENKHDPTLQYIHPPTLESLFLAVVSLMSKT